MRALPANRHREGQALNAAAEALSAAALAAVLAWAVARPRGWPEAVAAIPAAALVVGSGALPWPAALAEAARLGPVLGFLAAVLVLAQMCDDEGVFRACGSWLARGSGGRPVRLLTLVFVIAAATTAALSLDATVVLLTPVVFATASRLGARPKPHVYACTHLANSASLLLPVSNLTNLLAFAATGLTFTRFAGLMALPWLAAIAVDYAVLRAFFAADLGWARAGPPGAARRGGGGLRGEGGEGGEAVPAPRPVQRAAGGPGSAGRRPPARAGAPRFALATVAATLAGFVLASALRANPAWAALGGAAVLGARALARRQTGPAAIARAASVPFLAFVLGLGVVVRAVVADGLGQALAPLIPHGATLPALLALAAIAAGLANAINNLPAVLVMIPLVSAPGLAAPRAAAVLAVLVGANVGPNLTYAGSLATLLWRRVLHAHGSRPSLREFTALGMLSVPAGLGLAVLALWASLRIFGG